MRLEQLIAEAQYLRLDRDITGMAGNANVRRSVRLSRQRSFCDRVRVPVAGRDRASGRSEVAGKLPAHAGTTASHHRKLPGIPTGSAVPRGLGP